MHTIIIGAGIGGLTLAQGLRKAGLSCAVYERDDVNNFRPQGYRLRINPEGSAAIKENVPESTWELFRTSSAITTIGATNINPLSAEVTSRKQGVDASRPGAIGNPEDTYTCDRTVLRRVLMTGLDEVLHFGKVFKKYSIQENGKVLVEFADGTTAEGDILVGADGARSPVRRQYLPSHIVLDVGGRLIYGKTPITPALEASFTKHAMEWITVISDQRPLTLFLEPVRFKSDPGLLASHLPHVSDYIYWVLGANHTTFPMDDQQLYALSKEQLKDLSLSLSDQWHPSIRALLEHQDVAQTAVLPMSCAYPPIPAWTPSQVTLIGDACHVMPPAGGLGANTALMDAVELTKAIIQGATITDIGKFEEGMRARAGQIIQKIVAGGRNMFGLAPFEQLKPIQYH